VAGAPTQVCPHCAHETDAAPTGDASGLAPADPVGALALAWRLARSEYGRFLLLWVPALVVEAAAAFSVEAYVRAADIPLVGMTSGEQMQYLGVALPLYLLVFTARLASWTFVAARALDVASGGARLARWRDLLAPSLALGFVLTLVYAAGWLMLVVGFLVFFHWFLYAPAMLAEGARGIGEAFDRSRRFARERNAMGFTAVALLAGGALLVPYFLLASAPDVWGLLLPPAWGWLIGPVLPLIAASFVAVARSAPRPSGHVGAQARATTTCPQCGTLVPFASSGAGADVVCPACGRSGRVL
jgi:hypothetical protein